MPNPPSPLLTPRFQKSAAHITASAVLEYLEECASRERYPDRGRLEEIFTQNFAPIVPRMITLHQAWKAEFIKAFNAPRPSSDSQPDQTPLP